MCPPAHPQERRRHLDLAGDEAALAQGGIVGIGASISKASHLADLYCEGSARETSNPLLTAELYRLLVHAA